MVLGGACDYFALVRGGVGKCVYHVVPQGNWNVMKRWVTCEEMYGWYELHDDDNSFEERQRYPYRFKLLSQHLAQRLVKCLNELSEIQEEIEEL